MKKREIIGIILLVISIFLLLLSLVINIYLEQVDEKNKSSEKNVALTKNIFLNLKQFEGDLNETG